MTGIIGNASNLVEPCPVQRTFCTELARIETIGPCSMLIFVMEQAIYCGSEIGKERTIEARIVVPTDALPAITAMLARAFDRENVQRAALASFSPYDGRAN